MRWRAPQPKILAATLLCSPLPACSSASQDGEGSAGPLALERAEVVAGDTIRLSFSEPMAPPMGVDPADFRLTRVVREPQGATYFQACQCPPGMPDECTCEGHYPSESRCDTAAYSSYGDYFCQAVTAERDTTIYYTAAAYLDPEGSGRFTNIVQSGPDTLDGALGTPFDDAVCAPRTGQLGELVLHYAPSTVAVTAADGDALTAIAPDQVNDELKSIADGLLAGGPVPLDASILAAVCAGQACTDGLFDDDETDVDCGGPCHPCGTGKACRRHADCASGACVESVCVAAN